MLHADAAGRVSTSPPRLFSILAQPAAAGGGWATSFHFPMSLLALACLNTVHVVYAVYSAIYAFFLRFGHYPSPLGASRRRVPTHLALLLTCEDDADPEHIEEIYTHTLYNVARWCKLAGIGRLSVYDEQGEMAMQSICCQVAYSGYVQGVIEESAAALKELLGGPQPTDAFFRFHGNIVYPPTPPLSDTNGSRALTPERDSKIPLSVTTFQSNGSAGRIRKKSGSTKHVLNSKFCSCR
jgi:dehydrodolichyl diphosphate syntase complex subunit NUS1